jgi:Zn-dependent peptidase ImmA (M78 family)
MTTRREEILRATSEASLMFSRFPPGNRTSFDIIGATLASDIPLVFRPLKNLWGATVTIAEDLKGVMVTSQLGLAIQRFTLAHELGHVVLGHEQSLDKNVGYSGRFGPDSLPVEEIAADTFASELLAPRSLMLASAKRHGWSKISLTDPGNIYQLSLRLGISFQATCWALASHKVISPAVAANVQSTKPKLIKKKIVDEDLLTNPWADVWRITENDTDTLLEAGPGDIFSLSLNERASGGFLWELLDSGPRSEVISDTIKEGNGAIGEVSRREVLLRFPEPGIHSLIFEHRRPWSLQKIGVIDISVNNNGKEITGFPRRHKEHLLLSEAA